MSSNGQWLEWARTIQWVAQNGLHYTANPYDKERYEKLLILATQIIATHTHADLNTVQAFLTEQIGPMTPKVDVRGVVFNEKGQVLLVKELLDGGRWTLPGGWADPNEPPSLSTVREVREESGYEVQAVKLLAAYDRDLQGHPSYIFSVYKLFFLCNLIGGAPTTSIETGGVGWFAEDELPIERDLSVGRVRLAQLQRFFEHHRNPALPTDFD